jgi:hypothetical protein
MGGSEEQSLPSSFPAISVFADTNLQEDTRNRCNDVALLTNSPPHPSLMTREDRGRLWPDPQVHPRVPLHETAPPNNRVPPFYDGTPRSPYATYPSSSSGFDPWYTSSDAVNLSQRGAAYPSLPPAPGRRAELAQNFNHHHSSSFPSPGSCTSAASSFWIRPSSSPTLGHRKATQMQSDTAHFVMYPTSNSTQGGFPSSSSSNFHSFTNQSAQYPMTSNPLTCPQDYRPTGAQIEMTPAIPGGSLPTGQWGSASSVLPSRRYTHYSVDEEGYSNSGMPDVFSHHSSTQ